MARPWAGAAEPGTAAAGGAVMLVLAAVGLAIAVGAFLVRPWAWTAFMTWAAIALAVNLLRLAFFSAGPNYPTLAIATVTVFLLTPLDVQIAFGIRTPRVLPLDTPARDLPAGR